MTLKTTPTSIDVGGLTIRDYTEEEVKAFRRVRSEYSSLFHPILQALVAQPSLLQSGTLSYPDLLARLENILTLEEAEAWLSKMLERVSETRRAELSELKPDLDKITALGRAASSLEPKVGSLFAELFDFIAEPSKKGVSSQRSKKKAPPQT